MTLSSPICILYPRKTTVQLPTPPDLVTTMISPLPLAWPVRATICLGDFHSAVIRQSLPHIRRPAINTDSARLPPVLCSSTSRSCQEFLVKNKYHTYKVTCINSQVFSSDGDPRSRWSLLWGNACHLWNPHRGLYLYSQHMHPIYW